MVELHSHAQAAVVLNGLLADRNPEGASPSQSRELVELIAFEGRIPCSSVTYLCIDIMHVISFVMANTNGKQTPS